MNNAKEAEGSITVFLSFLFLLLLALTGSLLDSARYYSSAAYMKVTARAACMKTFGDYAEELYEDYGLYGYGGYDGISQEDWQEEFARVLQLDLTTSLHARENYGSVLQLTGVENSLAEANMLSDESEYMKQVKSCLEVLAVTSSVDSIKGMFQNDTGTKEEMRQQLKESDQAERTGKEKKNDKKEDQKGTNVEEEKAQRDARAEAKKEIKKDAAGGNPLECIKDILQDGVLQLVCDPKKISDHVVEARDAFQEEAVDADKEENKELTGSALVQQTLESEEAKKADRMEESIWSAGIDKSCLALYGSEYFSNYVEDRDRTQSYGQEYLVTGHGKEKDNLVSIVQRLLLIRTAINYIYLLSDPVYQEKSLATATTVAALLMAEPFITAIQQTILVILALEESCIDICGLLQGKQVPLVKTANSFKMRYEEICAGNRSLFQKRASEFSDSDGELVPQAGTDGLNYQQYLFLFMLMVPRKKLISRSLDLIQQDIRSRYNETFYVDECLCSVRVKVNWTVPCLAGSFLVQGTPGDLKRNLSIKYAYS